MKLVFLYDEIYTLMVGYLTHEEKWKAFNQGQDPDNVQFWMQFEYPRL